MIFLIVADSPSDGSGRLEHDAPVDLSGGGEEVEILSGLGLRPKKEKD